MGGYTVKRLAWCTDIHLNFLDEHGIEAFCRDVTGHEPDGVVITGDISDSTRLARHLGLLEKYLARPIYFVLGNHDFYGGSIEVVRDQVRTLSALSKHLIWLPAAGVVALSRTTALVGHDGWADGRLGDWAGSDVMLNDYVHIAELAGLGKIARLERLRQLADQAAGYLRSILPAALERHPRVLVVTHVPPFEAACWHSGRTSDEHWLPHFSSHAMGNALAEAMIERPDRQMVVLCGHTHGGGTARILPNLTVHTGGAEYGAPSVQQILET